MGSMMASVEKRLQGIVELHRRNLHEHGILKGERLFPTVTITREYGCEGYPVAQQLQEFLEKKTGLPWVVMDKELLAAVAQNLRISEEVLTNLGAKNRVLDEIFSTFSSHWKSDKDYYRMLARQILALAQGGNVILVGRGAVALTQEIANCYHFRVVAPLAYKADSLVRRKGVGREEAERMVVTHQRQRDAFIKEFLGRDLSDPTLYHLVFNNQRISPSRIARIMGNYICGTD